MDAIPERSDFWKKRLLSGSELVIRSKKRGKALKCPKGHPGTTWAMLRDKDTYAIFYKEYSCPVCSPTYRLSNTMEEAWDRRDNRQRRNTGEIIDRQEGGKKLRNQGFELVRDLRATCRNCGGKAEVLRLRPVGGGRPVSAWILCEKCSPAHFFLPATAEEAYERYLRKLEKKHGGEVLGTCVPDAA